MSASPNVDFKPSLPPYMECGRSRNDDNLIKMLGRSPLFMTSLDDIGGEAEDNVELEALRALQYEGTPAENSLSFKEQGNELVKQKQWGDAKEFYTKGIAVLTKKIGVEAGGSNPSEDRQAERWNEREIEEACYLNRALCNLELKNYRSTHLDCAAALRLNGKNIKAYYRSAQALYALDKLDEASDACMHGLMVDKANTTLRNLMEKIAQQTRKRTAAQEQANKEREDREKKKVALSSALRARSLRPRKTGNPPDLEDATIQLSPDPTSPKSKLHFPLLFLYPMHAQSDFIKACSETDTMGQHLEYVLPLPWDEAQEYQLKTVELYAETGAGGLTKVGKNLSLLEILTKGGVEIVDEIVSINVVPKAKAAAWIAEMRKRKASRSRCT